MNRRVAAVSVSLCMAAAAASAQGTPAASAPLTLDRAIEYAAEHYPSVRAAVEQVNGAAAGVDVADAAYLPRLDAVWQSNRATANNVFGQLLPQSVLPSISGPVLPAASSRSAWGSATGALFSWDILDFGLRHAEVDSAKAALERAKAGETLTRLDVQAAVAGAFLDVVAAEGALTAAQADVDRRDVLGRVVHTLVENQLRPGAEASRADAERAAAATRLVGARQRVSLAQLLLARLLGQSGTRVDVSSDALLSRTPPVDIAAQGGETHPLNLLRQAEINRARAEETALAHADLPHVYLQSSVFARGSGAHPDGTIDGGVSGLALDRANWAAGVQVVLPNVFDLSALRAKKAAASAATRAESALYEESVLNVESQRNAAAVLLGSAREIAANISIEVAAAEQSESQARTRYNSGLASITEVADAQNLLAQAEADDKLARVAVWRALLGVAAAQGDIAPFTALVRQP
jgi:outer membrane protein